MGRPSDLELFQATVSHTPHDNLLFYAHFIDDLLERVCAYTGVKSNDELNKHFGLYNPSEYGGNPGGNRTKPDFSQYFSDIEVPANGTINDIGLLEIPGSSFHFTRYISPLRNVDNLSEVEKFPFPETKGYAQAEIAAMVEGAHTDGRVASCWVGHMYEDAWQVRGYEPFLMDMIAAPEIIEYILDRFMERNLANAIAAAKAGVDVIRTGDDVANQKAMMFQPELWRKFMKPRWGKVMAAARSIKPDIEIWYHSDGNITDIVPELIEIGVTILNPVQPECVDSDFLKKEYGKHVVFDGTIGTQTTMPFGSTDDVRARVREVKKTLGYDGALIISPTHVLEPEVPIENIIAFCEECAAS